MLLTYPTNTPVRVPCCMLVTAVLMAALCSATPSLYGQPTSTDDAEAKAILTSAYQTSKNKPLTVEHCSQIIALCAQAQQRTQTPALTAYINQLTAWAHNKRGEQYLQLAGENEDSNDTETAQAYEAQAFQEFATAIAKDKQLWKAYHNRGVCLAIAGKAPEAIADFSQTIQLKKDYANAWFNRAELYLDLQNYPAAVTDYTEVLKLDNTDVTALIARGDAQLMLRKHQPAIADYTAAIKLMPDLATPLIQRGTAYRELGQWEAARTDYNKALKMDMTSAVAYQHTAWLLATCPEADIRNAELAVLAAEKAKTLTPTPDWMLLDTLAAAYANANRFDDAVQQLTAAISQAPAAEKQALERRLTLYQAGKPFRDAVVNP
ncbi:MAG TPA: hypothetical protein DCY79_22680 [Planctomycetaceae bacterium]|nr:hypothetical protein [Blastopirellula sp.]HAY82623.1 hypothetical protein [Planctomycetaceae bacterium]